MSRTSYREVQYKPKLTRMYLQKAYMSAVVHIALFQWQSNTQEKAEKMTPNQTSSCKNSMLSHCNETERKKKTFKSVTLPD